VGVFVLTLRLITGSLLSIFNQPVPCSALSGKDFYGIIVWFDFLLDQHDQILLKSYLWFFHVNLKAEIIVSG
jgi:hypothetical protein